MGIDVRWPGQRGADVLGGRELRDEQEAQGPYHAVLLDLDVPAYLVPSSTPGHSHLYVDVLVPKSELIELLEVLAKTGVIEQGYAEASIKRGRTCLRLPWVKKDLGNTSDA